MQTKMLLGQLGYEEFIFDSQNALWALSERFLCIFKTFLQSIWECRWQKVIFGLKIHLQNFDQNNGVSTFRVRNLEKWFFHTCTKQLRPWIWLIWCLETFSRAGTASKLCFHYHKLRKEKSDFTVGGALFPKFCRLLVRPLEWAFGMYLIRPTQSSNAFAHV